MPSTGRSVLGEPGEAGIGDLVQVVEVIRELAGREARYGLSVGERRLLAKARIILIQEGLCPPCFQLLIL